MKTYKKMVCRRYLNSLGKRGFSAADRRAREWGEREFRRVHFLSLAPSDYFFCPCAAGDGTAVERFFILAPASIADNLR